MTKESPEEAIPRHGMTTATTSKCQEDVLRTFSATSTFLGEPPNAARTRSSISNARSGQAMLQPPTTIRKDPSSLPPNVHIVNESTRYFAHKRPQHILSTNAVYQEAQPKRGRPRKYVNGEERARVDVIRKRIKRRRIAQEQRDRRFCDWYGSQYSRI